EGIVIEVIRCATIDYISNLHAGVYFQGGVAIKRWCNCDFAARYLWHGRCVRYGNNTLCCTTVGCNRYRVLRNNVLRTQTGDGKVARQSRRQEWPYGHRSAPTQRCRTYINRVGNVGCLIIWINIKTNRGLTICTGYYITGCVRYCTGNVNKRRESMLVNFNNFINRTVATEGCKILSYFYGVFSGSK